MLFYLFACGIISRIIILQKWQKEIEMRKLFRWANPYKFLIIMILLITILVPLTYSYIPQFIKYVVDIIFEGDLESEVTLPNFIVRFFESFTEPLSAVFVVGLFLLIFQFVRGVLLFI